MDYPSVSSNDGFDRQEATHNRPQGYKGSSFLKSLINCSMDRVKKTINVPLETEALTPNQPLLDEVESTSSAELGTVRRRERTSLRSQRPLQVEARNERAFLTEPRQKLRPRPRSTPVAELPEVPAALTKWLLYHLTGSKGWLAALAVTAAWGWWNGELLLSTGVGVLAMVLVYRMQKWDWPWLKSELYRFLSGSNRQLTLAVASGGFATLGTYMAISIWADAESHWIAFSMIVQTFGIVALLGVLAWRAIARKATQDETRLHQFLADLADADPMKRLIAVRQITSLLTHSQLHRTRLNAALLEQTSPKPTFTRSHVAECFRLMLSREPEALVRDAVLDALKVLDVTVDK